MQEIEGVYLTLGGRGQLLDGDDADTPAADGVGLTVVGAEPVAEVEGAQFAQRQIPHRPGSVGGSVESLVVDQHQLTVGGHVQIGVEHIGTGLGGSPGTQPSCSTARAPRHPGGRRRGVLAGAWSEEPGRLDRCRPKPGNRIQDGNGEGCSGPEHRIRPCDACSWYELRATGLAARSTNHYACGDGRDDRAQESLFGAGLSPRPRAR